MEESFDEVIPTERTGWYVSKSQNSSGATDGPGSARQKKVCHKIVRNWLTEERPGKLNLVADFSL